MDISRVRAGLGAAAGTVVSDPPLTTFGYVPDAFEAPCFFPAEVDVDFTGAFGRGLDELMVTCRVLVGTADDRASQQLLDGYLSGAGPASLKQALEADSTLGGACDDLMVLRVQGYRYYEHTGTKYVGAELVVKVIGDGS
ncbi:hypothetical protein [Micromonospora humidisoli]|uniref:Uncharacterized protein n=1 Tax=Micromonospora humidisoli TaxID=2807622 RepID=A0ABS2JC00_9ACTN|nr:hypothetical protein [Micromonospora humidisoli]MBM7083605.1 hypothetical protein [Micromonospora humidisoli]